jgi:hypothetical protein
MKWMCLVFSIALMVVAECSIIKYDGWDEEDKCLFSLVLGTIYGVFVVLVIVLG